MSGCSVRSAGPLTLRYRVWHEVIARRDTLDISLPLAWFDNRTDADHVRLLTCLDENEGYEKVKATLDAANHKTARTGQTLTLSDRQKTVLRLVYRLLTIKDLTSHEKVR